MKCEHCGEKDQRLDRDGFCFDKDACVERKPLTVKYTKEMYEKDRAYRLKHGTDLGPRS
jgi:hypothetical protein